MHAGDRIGEHRGQKEALGDLGALLVLLQSRRLGRELGVAWQEARKLGRGTAAELIDAQEAAPPFGQAVIHAGCVGAQVRLARGAVGGLRWGWKRIRSHGANYRPAGSWR